MPLPNKKVLVEYHVRQQAEPAAHADLFSVEDLQVRLARHHRVRDHRGSRARSADRHTGVVLGPDQAQQFPVGEHVHDPVLVPAGEKDARRGVQLFNEPRTFIGIKRPDRSVLRHPGPGSLKPFLERRETLLRHPARPSDDKDPRLRAAAPFDEPLHPFGRPLAAADNEKSLLAERARGRQQDKRER